MNNKVLLIMAGLSFLLASCHSDYLHLKYSTFFGAVYQQADSSNMAFVASKAAYLPATGISRFPDGGTPKYLFGDVGLYIFNDKSNHLQELQNFNDLASLIGSSSTNWISKIIYKDSLVYFWNSPVSAWNNLIKWNKNSTDSTLIFKIKNKYSKYYSLNLNTKNVQIVDSTFFNSLYETTKKKQKISLTKLNKKLKEVPLSDWGFILQEIYPKPDEKYINETIFLKNSSKVTRRAVIEQIISSKSKKEIKSILRKMEDYKNSLEGNEKKEYEIFSKDTYNKIQALL